MSQKLEDKHLIYLDDIMYLPIQYHRIQVKQPYFKGKGEHSVAELEELCEKFKEFCHQQNIIKHAAMKCVIKEKFDINLE